MRVCDTNPYIFSDCPENFDFNLKTNFVKSSLENFDFKLEFKQLSEKVLPVLRIFDSYADENLIKFEIYKNCIKISSSAFDIFSDIKIPLINECVNLNDNEYFEFVLDSEKLLKFLNILSFGVIEFSVDLKDQSLVLRYKDLTLNLRLSISEEFFNYEKYFADRELISNEFHCDNIKNGLDFCNLIFSRNEEAAKIKQIQLSSNLIYAHTAYIGSSAVFYENFGNVEYSVSHSLIKIFSQILPIFKGSETKIYKTSQHTIFKDSNILLLIPSPVNSLKDLKSQIEKLSFGLEAINKFSLNRKDIIQSLTALSIFLRDPQEDPIKLVFENNTLRISVMDYLTSKESFDKFPIRYEGNKITVSLKFDSIMKNLKFFVNRDLVDLEVVSLEENINGIRVIEEHNGVKYSSFFISGSNEE